MTEPYDIEKEKEEMLMLAFEEFDAIINGPRKNVEEHQKSLPESTVVQEERHSGPKHNSALINAELKRVVF